MHVIFKKKGKKMKKNEKKKKKLKSEKEGNLFENLCKNV